MSLKYNLVTVGTEQNLTLFHDGEMYVASEAHPNWSDIKRLLLEDDESVVDFFDVPGSLSKRFHRLTNNVTLVGGKILFDGDPIEDAISKKIVEHLDNGDDNWGGLVAFVEKVNNNPSENSRNQLYPFLEHREYDILPDGNILGYKGVAVGTTDGEYRSTRAGHAWVNDTEFNNAYIPQRVGDTVWMPRSEVDDNTGVGCSTGLHISDFGYAKSFGTHVLAVSADPRDMVSVPRHEIAKVRCSRYTVLGVVQDKEDRHSWKVPDPTVDTQLAW